MGFANKMVPYVSEDIFHFEHALALGSFQTAEINYQFLIIAMVLAR